MHRLKALLRRRSYHEESPVPPERNAARLSETRRSLRSHGGQSIIRGDRYVTGLNKSRRNESPGEHETNGHKNSNSYHPAITNTSSPATVQQNSRTSIEKIQERQRNVLVKNPKKDVPAGDISSYSYFNKEANTEKRSRNSATKIQNNKAGQPTQSTRERGRPVEVEMPNEEDNTTRPGERSDTERENTIITLRDTVDTDETITYAPAVTHETIRPHVHEILEEQIYREIHNHDVYHRIQPVYEVEILPARHFVPGPNGGLVEVPEDSIPECTGANQKWHVSKRPPRIASLPTLRQPDCIVKNTAVPEPNEEDAEKTDELEPTMTRTTIDNQEFKDVYFDSWQSSSARIF